MDKFKTIRPIVLGLVIRDGKILVGEGYDYKKNQTFYRALGGGIEFGETSKHALKREFFEELDVNVQIGEYLGIAENIFVFNGKPAHEIVLMYKANIKDSDYQESYIIKDSEPESRVLWVDIADFVSGEKILYPEEAIQYLK